MDMLDTKKMTRGITFWREDILKWRKEHGGKSLSRHIRDILHDEMTGVSLGRVENDELDRQIAEASKQREARKEARKQARKAKRVQRRGNGRGALRTRRMAVITSGEPIPDEVRANPVFVRTA